MAVSTRTFIVMAALAAGFSSASAQTAQDLVNDHKTPGDVLTYGMGYGQQRYSTLDQINKQTVRKLVPAWTYSMADNRGMESMPLVHNGVIYATDHEKTVALDAISGKELWKSKIEYPAETTRVVCCGIVNRGAVLFDGKVYRSTLDGFVIALDAKTGKEVWRTKSGDPKEGYSMTGAPQIANGVLIAGVAGAEYGHRGYLEGFDTATGKSLWKTYTVPALGEKGSETWANDSLKTGGGSTWITGSYDPELDLVFWGTGNPAPWNPRNRAGDNLYTNSILAMRPKTGEVVWHYQTTPNDPFDYDGVNELVHADLTIDGQDRKVVMQASRNGFLYVVERATGKLLAAHPFVNVNWAEKIDLASGRPVVTKLFQDAVAGTEVTVFPSNTGGKNWEHMSYNPTTKHVYINSFNMGLKYQALPPEQVANLKVGQPFYGVKRERVVPDAEVRGYLEAVDPVTGKAKWKTPFKSPNIASVLTTGGGLVFTGMLTGEFIAVDEADGKVLWKFQTPSGIVGQPVTWEKDGKQYVTVPSGIGGVYAQNAGDPNLRNVPAGGSLITFKLFDE